MASSVGIAGHPPSRPLTITHGIPERRAGPIVVASAPSRHPVRREGHSTDPADGPIPPPLCRSCSCGAPAPVRKPDSTPPVGPANHSFSFDQRGRPEALHTAMATAFFWPTSTTSRFQHGVVLGQHRDHHGRIFRAPGSCGPSRHRPAPACPARRSRRPDRVPSNRAVSSPASGSTSATRPMSPL